MNIIGEPSTVDTKETGHGSPWTHLTPTIHPAESVKSKRGPDRATNQAKCSLNSRGKKDKIGGNSAPLHPDKLQEAQKTTWGLKMIQPRPVLLSRHRLQSEESYFTYQLT